RHPRRRRQVGQARRRALPLVRRCRCVPPGDLNAMLALVIDDSVRAALPPASLERLRRRVARMVRAAWLAEDGAAELEVSMRLTDDGSIRELNRDFRHK